MHTLPGFNYAPNPSPNIRSIQQRTENGIHYHAFTFATPFGYRRAATLISPEGSGPFAAALFVHWFEPGNPTSNRRQFRPDAVQLASRGVVSLLVETMWSDDDWFYKRTQEDDIENSIRQVTELRLELDILLAQPGVDPQRLAFVGHDFGAMYGVLTGSLDGRPSCYVLMAGTPRFPDWYLYYPDLDPEARARFKESLAPLDPITHIAGLTPAPLLFQFAKDDPHVPIQSALDFYNAAAEPKALLWYDCGHGLNDEATADRLEWLTQMLRLN